MFRAKKSIPSWMACSVKWRGCFPTRIFTLAATKCWIANGGGSVKISVSDNGVGIPPENLNRIFNHGFTTKKEGHGFGLMRVDRIAEKYDGFINRQSEEGV